jgi:hypothetical protein
MFSMLLITRFSFSITTRLQSAAPQNVYCAALSPLRADTVSLSDSPHSIPLLYPLTIATQGGKNN